MSGAVELINPYSGRPLHRGDSELVDDDGRRFPWESGAYRLVEDDGYAASFGFQWNRFEQIQVDRFRTGRPQSRERFFAATGWEPERLAGKLVLEVGSGAGRFTQVVLSHTESEIYSVDLSRAVEANYRNNGPHPRLHLFQASIYDLPFADAQFDNVFCFGVLQHTPNARRAVESLVRMVKRGGELAVDFYPRNGWYTKFHIKYLLRPIAKRLDRERLLRLIDASAEGLITAHRFVHRMGVGRLARRLLPLCDLATLPPDLDDEKLREWAVLDTFDMFSPWYDQPQKVETVTGWLRELGMVRVWGGFVRYGDDNVVAVARGVRG